MAGSLQDQLLKAGLADAKNAKKIKKDKQKQAKIQRKNRVEEVDETKFSHKMPVRINGTTYFIMLTTS